MRVVGSLRRRLTPGDDESGFTIMELLVAMFIITAVLLVLMAVQTSAMVTNAHTRQRTQATAFANQTMEELRALPWLTLSKGLFASFQTAAGGDPNVASGKLHPAADPSINETLKLDSSQDVHSAPLSGGGTGTNKSVDTDPSIPGVSFVSRAYVTQPSTTANQLMLTVITSWTANQTGKAQSVVIRSQAYAPTGGCGQQSNQPFLGACQAIFSSSGGAAAVTTTVTGATPVTSGTPPSAAPGALPILAGSDYTTATLIGDQGDAAVTAQQATSVNSDFRFAGVTLATADASAAATTSGQAKYANAASNDVGSAGAAPASPADVTATSTAAPLSITSGSTSLAFTPGSAVSGTAKSSTTAACLTGMTSGQPCGSASLTGGVASSLTLTVGSQAFTAASVAGGGTTSVFGGRFTSTVGTTAVGCTALSGAGCVSAGVTRSIGTATFGTGPWSASASSLVTITGYQESVLVDRGASQKATAGILSRAGTITYWNGSSTSSLSLATTTTTTITTPARTWTSGGKQVSATATITVTPATSIQSSSDAATCSGDGCTIDANSGTVSVSVTWTVTNGSDTSAFTAVTVLGGARANAAYKAAPSA